MFGKPSRMSANEKFVMGAGRKAGNLKGNGTAPRTPKVTPQPMMASKLPSADAMKRGVQINQNKPQSLGKSNTFNTTKRNPR